MSTERTITLRATVEAPTRRLAARARDRLDRHRLD